MPPEALSVWEYALPVAPDGRLAVVMVGADGSIDTSLAPLEEFVIDSEPTEPATPFAIEPLDLILYVRTAVPGPEPVAAGIV